MMGELKRIVEQKTAKIEEYGEIKIKLAEVLTRRNITRNQLSTAIGVKYEIVNRYYRADNIERFDLDFLAKVCYALDCKVEDLLEYHDPEPKADNLEEDTNV